MMREVKLVGGKTRTEDFSRPGGIARSILRGYVNWMTSECEVVARASR